MSFKACDGGGLKIVFYDFLVVFQIYTQSVLKLNCRIYTQSV